MKIRRISQYTSPIWDAGDRSRRRNEAIRTIVAVALAVGLIGTGAVALPSLAPMHA